MNEVIDLYSHMTDSIFSIQIQHRPWILGYEFIANENTGNIKVKL
jgi:hypothetical protein